MRDHPDEIVEGNFAGTGDSPLDDVVSDVPPFEVDRPLTEIGNLADAPLQAPCYRQIWDFHSKIVDVDAAALWAGTADYSGTWRADLDPDHWGYEMCLKHQRTGEYIGGHCQVFTPALVPRRLRQDGQARPDRLSDRHVSSLGLGHDRVPARPREGLSSPVGREPPCPATGGGPVHGGHRSRAVGARLPVTPTGRQPFPGDRPRGGSRAPKAPDHRGAARLGTVAPQALTTAAGRA